MHISRTKSYRNKTYTVVHCSIICYSKKKKKKQQSKSQTED